MNHVHEVGMHHLSTVHQLRPVLNELHNLGLLIVIGSASDPRDHWLLLNASALTEEVHVLLILSVLLM